MIGATVTTRGMMGSNSGTRTTMYDTCTTGVRKLRILTSGVGSRPSGYAHFVIIAGRGICLGRTSGVDVRFRLPRRDKTRDNSLCSLLSRFMCGGVGVAGVRSEPIGKGR